jgi:hypothetical protein
MSVPSTPAPRKIFLSRITRAPRAVGTSRMDPVKQESSKNNCFSCLRSMVLPKLELESISLSYFEGVTSS